MFFPRLRRRAKWVFLLLAVFFAFGFVAFGVGAGGSGIGDYFADLFNRNSVASGQPSVEDAQKKVAENPNDPKARLEPPTPFRPRSVPRTRSRSSSATWLSDLRTPTRSSSSARSTTSAR